MAHQEVAYQLLRSGSVRIDMHIDDLYPQVIKGFLNLLTEDEEYLEKWRLRMKDPNNPDKFIPRLHFDDDTDDLLLERKPDEKGHDEKDGFHYRPWAIPLLQLEGVDYERHLPFLEACHELHSRCYTYWLRVCTELDRELPGRDFFARAVRSPFHCLRILQYRKRRPGTEIIGRSHVDKCAATVHLAEEHEACILDGELLKFIPNQPVLFAAKKLENAVKDLPDGIKAMPHHVEVLEDCPESRWVIVFFAHICEGELFVDYSAR